MTAPDLKPKWKRGDLKAAVFALADGTLSPAQIARQIGASRASVNGVVQRFKLHDKVAHRISVRRKVYPLAEALAVPTDWALVRQAMAAWQMAYQEPDRDNLDDDEADRISAMWFAKWMGINYPTSAETEEHSGDCTKQPWSCLRCNADEVFRSVDAALRALGKWAE